MRKGLNESSVSNGGRSGLRSHYLRTGLIFLVLVTSVGCDQISKRMVRQSVDFHEQINIIPDFLTLTKVENTGAFLSLGDGLPPTPKLILLVGLPSLMLMFAFLYLFTNRHLSIIKAVSMACIVGGGVGNIYDRVIHGSVTDFLHLDFRIFETGVFNLADVSIMTGAAIILLDLLFNRE